MQQIEDICVKTVIAAHKQLLQAHRVAFHNEIAHDQCFQILGVDIILDQNLKPWLIEVNKKPSFATDSTLDKNLKRALIHDTIHLLNLGGNQSNMIIQQDQLSPEKERRSQIRAELMK